MHLQQIDEHDSGTESDGVIDVEDKFSKFDIGKWIFFSFCQSGAY